MEEHWQGLAMAQILHICLRETAPGSPLQDGYITQEQHWAQTKGENGRSEPPWDVAGGMLCLQSLCQS